MRLDVRTGDVGCHVMAKLCDVYPDGDTRRIVDGACLVAPGATDPVVEVDLGQTGYRVRAGHRLRLEIASSAFPRYIPHPGTLRGPVGRGRHPGERDRDPHGRRRSSLLLTVIRGPAVA